MAALLSFAGNSPENIMVFGKFVVFWLDPLEQSRLDGSEVGGLECSRG